MLTVSAGFFLGSKGHMIWSLFFWTLLGVSLIIASGCIFNNYIDREIDAKMERTKDRPLVKGSVSLTSALTTGVVSGIAGIIVLLFYTNYLALFIGLLGLFFYLIPYSIAKRRSVYGPFVGSIAGAVPLVAGYSAASNRFDTGAIILFAILCLWQIPHFLSISIYRLNDYASASIPVLPVKKGIYETKKDIIFYIVAFIVASILLAGFGYARYFYLTVVLLLGLSWLWLGIKGFKAYDDRLWARSMFFFSLITLASVSLAIIVDSLL